MSQTVRPTKKQRLLLEFIDSFIGEHGYSPSYREIMNGLNYTSVATVSLHVNNLISRGHLRKRDYSARSLEVVKSNVEQQSGLAIQPGQEKWLVDHIEKHFRQLEAAGYKVEQRLLDDAFVLVGALRALGLDGAFMAYAPRLLALRQAVAGDSDGVK